MTWEPSGNKIAEDKLGPLVPVDVLFEFEGEPLVFVARDPDGDSLLLHNVTVFDRTTRYVISTIDSRILGDLKAGRIDILTALHQPRCWIADVADDAKIKALWRVEFSSIPEKVLPKPGAMVNPDHDPMFRIRLIGSGVGPGKTSAADIRMAAQAAESGLRGLARIAFDEKKKAGPVPRDIRHFSDLPYLASRAASFEIAFGRPQGRLPGIDNEIFDEMGSLLEKGLSALRSDTDDAAKVEGLNDDQAVQLFEAIKALTPPLRGGVDRVEIGGVLVDRVDGPRLLTRDDRALSNHRIRMAKKPSSKDAPFRLAGVMEVADVGMLRFTLRQVEMADMPPGAGSVNEISFSFDDRLFDAVSDAWNSQDLVVVVGERVGTEFRAIDIQVATDPPADTVNLGSAEPKSQV